MKLPSTATAPHAPRHSREKQVLPLGMLTRQWCHSNPRSNTDFRLAKKMQQPFLRPLGPESAQCYSTHLQGCRDSGLCCNSGTESVLMVCLCWTVAKQCTLQYTQGSERELRPSSHQAFSSPCHQGSRTPTLASFPDASRTAGITVSPAIRLLGQQRTDRAANA